MNVHVSYKNTKSADVEEQFHLQIEKLRKRLQVFRPELVHLHAVVDESLARERCVVALNLRLPSGQMASRGVAERFTPAVKMAFNDLLDQLTKHKDHLRNHYKWPRRREGGREGLLPQVPFEETLAAIRAPTISEEDISRYVSVNLFRLVRFVDRELRYRENSGQIRRGQVLREEVIDEAIATALGDSTDKPERLALEPWLYGLAVRSIDELAQRSREEAVVSLEEAAREPNVEGSDELRLQFHQPDGEIAEQDTIADAYTATPEDIAASDEFTSLVEAALLGATREDREAFLLYVVEGFTPEEIAAISGRQPEQVKVSIITARDHLRKALPLPGELKDKLLQRSRIA